MARAIRSRIGIFDDAVLCDQLPERRRVVLLECIVVSSDDLGRGLLLAWPRSATTGVLAYARASAIRPSSTRTRVTPRTESFIRAEAVTPADGRPIPGNDDVFDLEGPVRVRNHRLPEGDVGLIAFDPQPVGRRLHRFHDAIRSDEIAYFAPSLSLERGIEAPDDLCGDVVRAGSVIVKSFESLMFGAPCCWALKMGPACLAT